VTEAAKILVAGLPAEVVREIGLRLAGVVVSEFEDTKELARVARKGEARLVVLTDALPEEDSINVARHAREYSDDIRIAYCFSTTRSELALRALTEIGVDRFFLSPLDVEEMLRELANMARVELLAPQPSPGGHAAAAIFEAWGRASAPTLQKIDMLEDAAIAVLDNSLTPALRASAQLEAQTLSELAARFGFQSGSEVAGDIAERFASESLTAVDGVAISEELLLLRQHLSGPPQRPPSGDPSFEGDASSRRAAGLTAADDASYEGARILVIDDEPQITRGLASLLELRKMSVTTLNDPLRFWAALDEAAPNVVLLDLEMPKLSGTELCRAMRSDRRWSEVPVVFLTGHTDHESVRRMFAAGADDYVGKPFVSAELMTRIGSRLTSAKGRGGPVESDPVTGLPTARSATELIRRFLRLARRKSDPYSVAVLQIDDFAGVVKTHGRRLSDTMLRAIGELLQQSFRGEDVVGLWGTSEFTIGMYGSAKEQSGIKLTQITTRIAGLSFPSDGAEPMRVQCTGGVSQAQVDGDDVGALRGEALKALQLVREIGLGRVGISGVRPAGPMTRRVDVAIVEGDAALVGLLRHAIESRGMSVAAFADGQTAAETLTGTVPELHAEVILLGLDLPSLNGLEVLRRLNAVEVTRVSKVVMLTARTDERDILAALELGAIDHIAKPFSVPVLVHKVRTALRQNQP
jgi:diguanylate cyclase (GGDEF)-like protein